MAAAKRHSTPPVELILDLGSGTGTFSQALAETFDADVLAVEPNEEQRGKATAHERVTIVDGRGDAIPAEDASVDLVWASGVLHHIHDLDATVKEIARVVRAGATILVREDRGTAEILEAFERVGFSHFFKERIEPLDLLVIR